MRFVAKLQSFLRLFGIDFARGLRAARGITPFMRDYWVFRRLVRQNGPPVTPVRFYPCLEDRFLEAGTASGSYFHQDILVARRILDNKPVRHVDIGSRIDGFVAHVAVFREIDVFDIRKLSTTARNITFHQLDLMRPLADDRVECCDSLSCLHALEHFGLGRYGDPVDPDGHKKALGNMIKMVKQGGTFYLSVPIGPERIEFNGHRIFNPRRFLLLIGSGFILKRFSFVDDKGDLHDDVEVTDAGLENAFGCNFGIGIFEFRRMAGAHGFGSNLAP